MKASFYGVIMAGGRGTRFWPLSTREMPKQFLKLTGEKTMLQETAIRFKGICDPGRIMVVTGIDHRETVLEQLPCLEQKNLLLEPTGRNTAACIGWAARTLFNRGEGSAIMAVVPSDHVVDNPEGFRETLSIAVVPAMDGMLVTVGIPPDYPATGYGYLEQGEEIGRDVYRVSAFREKPDPDTAIEYAASKRYFWNAGMFIWRADTILKEITLHLPELAEGLEKLDSDTSPELSLYNSLPSISIDYGVMEKAGNVAMVPARFGWNDIGDWPTARKCNVAKGEVISIDCEITTVWSEGKLTVLMGLKNVSVV
ncbi:MAG: mannose-1-phosphate guanylyltransferase, partial [Candidatus Aegiribacteria sp.]|nr:mannose-1-phosphate guanylyltransferase [Candidatus Aegiribacteria sp.]